LSLSDVSYEVHGRVLVERLSFILEAGCSTFIMGPNGAGKSVTLRLCHGLLSPSQGEIRWLGVGSAQVKSRQAMVFQQPVMLRRSAAANVDYALRLRGVPREERRGRVNEALCQAGLVDLARRPAHVLSGGERQRLALARAWALRPEVLFLDEPTSNLDPTAVHAVEAVIRVFRDQGTKIVMTTHDLGQARRLADEVLFLHRGRLVERAVAREFFEHPRSVEAQAFLQGELLW
jgi:tungstate transport system ATP-binding protein